MTATSAREEAAEAAEFEGVGLFFEDLQAAAEELQAAVDQYGDIIRNVGTVDNDEGAATISAESASRLLVEMTVGDLPPRSAARFILESPIARVDEVEYIYGMLHFAVRVEHPAYRRLTATPDPSATTLSRCTMCDWTGTPGGAPAVDCPECGADVVREDAR